MGRRIWLAAVAGLSLVGTASAQQGKSVAPDTNVGTLMCTLAAGDVLAEKKGDLTCTFDPITGPKAQFAGFLKEVGNGMPHGGKWVLMWSVLYTSHDLEPSKLEGQYVGVPVAPTGKEGASGGLTGGADQRVMLRPLATDASPAPTLTVLELRLSGMKA